MDDPDLLPGRLGPLLLGPSGLPGNQASPASPHSPLKRGYENKQRLAQSWRRSQLAERGPLAASEALPLPLGESREMSFFAAQPSSKQPSPSLRGPLPLEEAEPPQPRFLSFGTPSIPPRQPGNPLGRRFCFGGGTVLGCHPLGATGARAVFSGAPAAACLEKVISSRCVFFQKVLWSLLPDACWEPLTCSGPDCYL